MFEISEQDSNNFDISKLFIFDYLAYYIAEYLTEYLFYI